MGGKLKNRSRNAHVCPDHLETKYPLLRQFICETATIKKSKIKKRVESFVISSKIYLFPKTTSNYVKNYPNCTITLMLQPANFIFIIDFHSNKIIFISKKAERNTF